MRNQRENVLAQIERFDLHDENAEWPLTRRIACEHQWSEAYTHRVVAEYKRFAVRAARRALGRCG